jgi:F0F1-type ATP synthase assembly protein I
MKLLRPHVRVDPKDHVGQGMDAVFVVVLFFGIGFFIDRQFGSTPWAMIISTTLGAVGVFYKLKGAYEAKMAEHEHDLQSARSMKP